MNSHTGRCLIKVILPGVDLFPDLDPASSVCLVDFHAGRCLIMVVIPCVDLNHVLAVLALLNLQQHFLTHGECTSGFLHSVHAGLCHSSILKLGFRCTWVSSSQSDSSLSEVTFLCGGSPTTSCHVGACLSVIIFLCRVVASTQVEPSSPRGGVGQHDQSLHSALSHSSPESEGSPQLSVSDSSSPMQVYPAPA